MSKVQTITLNTPATAGNVGPGHDSFGLAFGIYNTFQFSLTKSKYVVTVKGRGLCLEQELSSIPEDESNLVLSSFFRACEEWKLSKPAGLHVEMSVGIPLDRGLGSSATARVAGVLAARELLSDSTKISDRSVESLAARLEGHPDNALPCLHGGFVVTVGDRSLAIKLPNPPAVALCVPKELTISTEAARRVIPSTIDHSDAVYSSSRAALLAVCLATGRHSFLKGEALLDDKLHEPYRGPLIAGFYQARRAARKAGAYGLVISGSGPSLLVLAEAADQATRAGQAVVELWQELKIPSWLVVPEIPESGVLQEAAASSDGR